jgi:fatty acid desaturase
MTRTVVYRGWLGRLLSRTQLFVDHHGTHHRWPRIPWFDLPRATALARLHGAEPFATHAAALRDALPHLADPRVGPQWIAAPRPGGGAGPRP